MSTTLFIATRDGLLVCEPQGNIWQVVRKGLEDHEVTCVAAQGGVILAGTTQGVFRSEDHGRTWQEASAGLNERHLRWLAIHPEMPGLSFAGTEPAEVFVSSNSGANWHLRPEVGGFRHSGGWYLPYSPAAGCVRGFAFHGERAYAAAEVGGVLRSDDHGETWFISESGAGFSSGQVNPDVHSIETHPTSPELVYAPTGGGFYRSQDGGAGWELLYRCYCRAVWVDPADPAHMILGPADGVDRGGRVEVTYDGGRTWEEASAGLETPWLRHMVERIYEVEGELLAVLSNGELYAAPLVSLVWRRILPEVENAHAVATMRD